MLSARIGRQPRRPWRSNVVRGLVVFLAAFAGFAIRALREEDPALRDRIRAFNRRWANPVVLRFAGNLPWGLAALEHRGRRSGALHATPLSAWPVSGGFLVPMPYGEDVDWARNLRHAGEAVLQRHGVRYRIGTPRLVPTTALRELPASMRTLAGLLGLRAFMRVAVLPESPSDSPPPA